MKRIQSRRCLSLWLLPIVFLFGCSSLSKVGPDYVPPQSQVPQGWQQPPDPALVPGKTEIKNYWMLFNDPVLTRLIEQVFESNPDVRIAIARVNEARARLGIATGQQVPVVDAGGSAARERVGGVNQTRYSVNLDAGWEIDLFGKISRGIEAATAEFQATEEDRNDVMITMYAEMARTYLLIRTLQTRLKAANGNIESQREILSLTQSRLKHGLATALDVAQSEQVLASSEAAVPPLRIELARSINTIALLLGKPPGTFYELLGEERPVPLPPLQVAVGVPADLIRQRPDIRRAERQLAAQTARIGIATADLYPSFSLTGSLGVGSLDVGDLFNPASRLFSIGPQLRWNIFDSGRIRNQIKVEDARTEQALIVYERTVLDAINEVENAMTSFIEQRIQFEAQLRSVQAARRSLELATGLYTQGLSNFQSVLDSQRAVFDYENQAAEAQGKASINIVRLYKALGGGWDPDAYDNRQTSESIKTHSGR